jgi:hypothetical protein
VSCVPLASAARVLAYGLVAFFCGAPAMAEMIVTESNVPEFAVGSVLPNLPDRETLKLPAGGRVRVLLLPSNATKLFEGEALVTRSSPFMGTRRPNKKKGEQP